MPGTKAEVVEAPMAAISDSGDKDGDSKSEFMRGDATASTPSDSHDDLLDFTQYHEHNAGRLVVDPEYVDAAQLDALSLLTIPTREARIEFGERVASRLKLSSDGKKVLWPQPRDDPEDPQNVRLSVRCGDDVFLRNGVCISGPMRARIFSSSSSRSRRWSRTLTLA